MEACCKYKRYQVFGASGASSGDHLCTDAINMWKIVWLFGPNDVRGRSQCIVRPGFVKSSLLSVLNFGICFQRHAGPDLRGQLLYNGSYHSCRVRFCPTWSRL